MIFTEEIQPAYARISEQRDDAGSIEAYRRFVDLVLYTKPSVPQMADTSLEWSRALEAIDAGLELETHHTEDNSNTKHWTPGRSDRLFAKTGTIVVANMSHILGVRSFSGSEPHQNGNSIPGNNLDHYALINAARAVLCYTVGAHQTAGNNADIDYIRDIDLFIEHFQHSQQIAFAAMPGPFGVPYVAGAAGIKPSRFTLSHLDELATPQDATPDDSRLSGFFGRMAAVSVLSQASASEQIPPADFSTKNLSANILSLMNEGINIH